MAKRIIKIGGSLLARPRLLEDLHAWRRQFERQGDTTIAIVGGGQMIEAVRTWDRLRPGRPTAVHWRCVEMLRHSYDCLREAIELDSSWNRWRSIDTASQWRDWLASSDKVSSTEPTLRPEFVLLNVPAFYTPELSRASSIPLPGDWRTTTDAIAMWLAHQLSSEFGLDVRCFLLKSCDISPNWSLASLVKEGVIDPACLAFQDVSLNWQVQRLADSTAANPGVSTLDLADR